MKVKFILAGVLICLVVGSVAHAVAVQRGTLQVVLLDIRSVIIDQQRYQLVSGAKVYRQSAPDDEIVLTTELEGSRVEFDTRYSPNRGQEIVYLMVVDK